MTKCIFAKFKKKAAQTSFALIALQQLKVHEVEAHISHTRSLSHAHSIGLKRQRLPIKQKEEVKNTACCIYPPHPPKEKQKNKRKKEATHTFKSEPKAEG